MTSKKIYTDEEARLRKNIRQREYEKRTGYAATSKYLKEHSKSFAMRFLESDMDLYDWLDKQENKAGYIKELIRRDMESHS